MASSSVDMAVTWRHFGREPIKLGQKRQPSSAPMRRLSPLFHIRSSPTTTPPGEETGARFHAGMLDAEIHLMSRTFCEQARFKHFLVQLVHGRLHRLGEGAPCPPRPWSCSPSFWSVAVILVGGHGDLVGVLGGVVFPGFEDESWLGLSTVLTTSWRSGTCRPNSVLGPHHVLLSLKNLRDQITRRFSCESTTGFLQGHVDFLEGDRGGHERPATSGPPSTA